MEAGSNMKVGLSPRRPLFGLLYQSRMIGDECGAVGGMTIGRGNRSTRRKLATLSSINHACPDP
jgi:hypothetical protein